MDEAGLQRFYGRQGGLIRCETLNTSGTPGIGWQQFSECADLLAREGASLPFSGAPKKKPAIDIDAGFPCLLAPQLLGMDFVNE